MKMKMSASKIGLRPRRKHGSTKTSGDTSKEPSPDSKCPSPDSKCPICLDAFNNMSYLDLCLHKFCFRCIHEWSKNKAECPLCKQPFNSIYHSIKSDQDFKKYDLRPTENGSFGSFGGVRFRYHTTMTGVRQRAERRTASPPDHGVLFESWGDAYQLQERSLRRMMLRLAARRRAAREGRAVRAVREQEMIAFRRALYRRGVRVQSVENGGRSRDITAEFFQRNPACLHRLVPWLKRELMVLYGAHGSLVNIVQHVVMSRITRFDLEASDILEELRPFLQARTEHFLHEFISFAKSPFNMEGYDQHAVYDCPDSLLNDGGDDDDDDSSSRSSVIAISEDDQMSLDLDTQGESVSSGTLSQSAWDDETPGPSYSTLDERGKSLPLSIPDSDSSQEDEPTESSSSSRLKRHSSNPRTDAFRSVVKKDGSLLSSDDDDDDDLVGDAGDEDDCIIVGFVKPLVQRTPELVQLSSDDSSEESVHVEVDRKPQLPQHIRFTTPGASPAPAAESSLSPPASDRRGRPSTSKAQSGLARSGRPNSSERRRGAEGCRQRRTSRSGNRTRRSRRDRRSGSASDSSGIPATSSPSAVVTLSRSRRRRRRRHSRSSSSRERSRSKKDGKERRQNGGREAPRRSKRASSRSSTHRGRDRDSEKMVYYSRGRRGVASRSRSRSRSREPRHGGPRGDDSPSPPTGAYSSGSRSPSSRKRLSHDKPGGKRKYKTRHLEQEPDKSVDLRTSAGKQKRSKREKSAKEKRDTGGRGDDNDAGNGTDRGGEQQQHHKKKKKHKKKKSKKHRSRERTGRRSPAAVITIESDSDGRSTDGNVDLSGKDGITTSATGVTPPDTDHVVDDVSNKSDPLPADGVLFTPTINDNNNKKNS